MRLRNPGSGKGPHFMKGIKLKALSAGRKGVLAGAAVAVVGLSLLGSASIAHAAVGTSIGTLTLSAPTGSLTSARPGRRPRPARAPPTGPPSLEIVLSDGVSEQAWSANINGAASALSGEALRRARRSGRSRASPATALARPRNSWSTATPARVALARWSRSTTVSSPSTPTVRRTRSPTRSQVVRRPRRSRCGDTEPGPGGQHRYPHRDRCGERRPGDHRRGRVRVERQ